MVPDILEPIRSILEPIRIFGINPVIRERIRSQPENDTHMVSEIEAAPETEAEPETETMNISEL